MRDDFVSLNAFVALLVTGLGVTALVTGVTLATPTVMFQDDAGGTTQTSITLPDGTATTLELRPCDDPVAIYDTQIDAPEGEFGGPPPVEPPGGADAGWPVVAEDWTDGPALAGDWDRHGLTMGEFLTLWSGDNDTTALYPNISNYTGSKLIEWLDEQDISEEEREQLIQNYALYDAIDVSYTDPPGDLVSRWTEADADPDRYAGAFDTETSMVPQTISTTDGVELENSPGPIIKDAVIREYTIDPMTIVHDGPDSVQRTISAGLRQDATAYAYVDYRVAQDTGDYEILQTAITDVRVVNTNTCEGNSVEERFNDTSCDFGRTTSETERGGIIPVDYQVERNQLDNKRVEFDYEARIAVQYRDCSGDRGECGDIQEDSMIVRSNTFVSINTLWLADGDAVRYSNGDLGVYVHSPHELWRNAQVGNGTGVTTGWAFYTERACEFDLLELRGPGDGKTAEDQTTDLASVNGSFESSTTGCQPSAFGNGTLANQWDGSETGSTLVASPIHPVKIHAFPNSGGPKGYPETNIENVDIEYFFKSEEDSPQFDRNILLPSAFINETFSKALAVAFRFNPYATGDELETDPPIVINGMVDGVNRTLYEKDIPYLAETQLDVNLTRVDHEADIVEVEFQLRDVDTGDPVLFGGGNTRGTGVDGAPGDGDEQTGPNSYITVNGADEPITLTDQNGSATRTYNISDFPDGGIVAKFVPRPWYRVEENTRAYQSSTATAQVPGQLPDWVSTLAAVLFAAVLVIFLVDRLYRIRGKRLPLRNWLEYAFGAIRFWK